MPSRIAPFLRNQADAKASPRRDLETQYDIVLPREEGFETLAGFVMSQLNKIPKAGERFEYDGRRYTVLQMDGHRIVRVKIESVNPPTGLEQAI